ncbi:hybrid sensor histidine kinase/response regulator [Oscillatoria acuminata]|uniref:histidine kinase n=1 Tax=Oscillatoria acuminata PCC 6304 TaxID=56110 RepID=K9TLY3_9CYAN|nr:hybrid sensor histidine kinase/response regulator [Oscillatoria acuminata]AFY83545.1 histidine kinase,Response regulator receiver domain protein,histidine kinase [Oscillatoria acuminata PCC 6304]
MNSNDSPNNSPLILLVDDDRTTRMLLRRAMHNEGYRVVEAADGIEGLELYKQHKPDMVLLDAKMPGMDGFTCCTQINAIAGGLGIPVLMITSLEDEDSVDRAFEAGATDYITKPIHWAVLRRRVQRLLQEKQAEREILKALDQERELNELRSRIVTMVSHEYRTPLTAILSSAELLECYWHKWDEQKRLKHLERIQLAATHLTQLVADVLSINEVESGQIEFNPAPVNLERLCQEAIAHLRLSPASPHQITLTHHGDDCDVILDGKLVQQMLISLLSNSIKYSPKGGNIDIELIFYNPDSLPENPGFSLTEAELNNIESPVTIFRVKDQGFGILPHEQGKIFNAFHRGSNVGTIQGTGLGLAIAKKCVELHRGEISIASEVGVGTTVTVTLPSRTSALPLNPG